MTFTVEQVRLQRLEEAVRWLGIWAVGEVKAPAFPPLVDPSPEVRSPTPTSVLQRTSEIKAKRLTRAELVTELRIHVESDRIDARRSLWADLRAEIMEQAADMLGEKT